MPRLREDWLNSEIRKYVIPVMMSRGHDPSHCELCGVVLENPTIHHKKYDGATVEDLVFACMRCQNKPLNKGLK